MKKILSSTLLIFVLSLTQIANAESPPKLNHQTLIEFLSAIYHSNRKEYRYEGFHGVQGLSKTNKAAYFFVSVWHENKIKGVYRCKAHIIYLTNDIKPKYNSWYISLVEMGDWSDTPIAKVYDHHMIRIDKERLEKVKKRFLKK